MDYFAFIWDFKNYSFNNTKFCLSFHLTISFQGYNVKFSEYHEIIAKILWNS